MFTRFDATKSTKGASKLRRDLINAEIANLRDLLPLPPSTRQRLSQLQLMALVCVYVRKANYFQQVFKRHELAMHHLPAPNVGFSKALSGFLMMMTQNGKLLYISDNAAEYLGHSMEDLLIHGDSVYDMIDKQDHQGIQSELLRTPTSPQEETRIFLARMNVSRNARRQMRFGDQKVILVQGHYLSYLPLCSRNEPVFLATCTPIAMPETRECVVQGATNVFTTIHSMDMKFVHVDKNGEWHLGFTKSELVGGSWYQILHNDTLREAQNKHRLISQSEQDRSCILLIRVQRRDGTWLWVHCVLQVKENMDNSQQPLIVATNQVLSEKEAGVMRANSWLYHYYSVQSKLQYGLGGGQQTQTAYESQATPQSAASTTPSPASSRQQYYQPTETYHQHYQPISYRRREEPVDYSVGSPGSSPGVILELGKAPPEPPDHMEQWNPSPPWSDTALQKVPEVLSPYVTTTPPTPGSAPAALPPPAFTFDWGEHHVVPEEPCWHHPPPPDHRLFPLQPPPRPHLLLLHHQPSVVKDERHHEAYESVN